MKNFDVVVVGGGVMGLSTAWQLSKSGLKVLIIDQFQIPNDIGSSHGGSRITRTAYFEHPNYVPLLQESHELWRELELETSTNLLNWVGGLYIGHPESEMILGTMESARTHDLKTEQYTADALNMEFPQFHVPEHLIGLYEQDAGILLPERCIQSLKARVLELGATIYESEQVISINASESGSQILTDKNKYFAAHLVLTAGSWANQWLKDFSHIMMRITRQAACWFEVKNPSQYQNLPISCFQDENEPFYYSFPQNTDEYGVKMAIHDPGEEVDPNTSRVSSTEEIEEVRIGFRKYYREPNNSKILRVSTCLYTNSPDLHFIVDQLEPNVSIITGCSGHGFKFAPMLGKIIAERIQGRTIPTADFLKLNRFNKI